MIYIPEHQMNISGTNIRDGCIYTLNTGCHLKEPVIETVLTCVLRDVPYTDTKIYLPTIRTAIDEYRDLISGKV